MKHSVKSYPSRKSRMALATASALAGMAYMSHVHAASTPYPQVPLVWQSGTSTIKPNILLFLDTSGSMGNAVWQNGTNQGTRLNVGRAAIRDVITDTRENNRWGLATFVSGRHNPLRSWDALASAGTRIDFSNNIRFNTGNGALLASGGNLSAGWTVIGGQIRMPIQDVDAANNTNYNNLMTQLNALQSNTWTPIASSYYELTRYYRGMTPGLPGLTVPGGGASYTSPIQYRCQRNYIIYISDGEPTGMANRYQLGSLFHNDPLMASLQPAVTARANVNNGVTEQIAGFVANNDLMVGGTDAEGQSFDDPDFANQTITTYTVGFAANIPVLQQMAQNSGGQYFLANDGDQLRAALRTSLQAIAQDAGYTPSAPSVSQASDGTVTSAVATTVNPKTWTSELRFYPYNAATQQFDLNTYQVPKYRNGNNVTSRALFSTPSGVSVVTQGNIPAGFDNNLFGISSSRTDVPSTVPGILPITRSTSTTEYRNLVSWLLRWGTADTTAGTNYRDRNDNNVASLARYMGDVSSNILTFGDIKVAAASANDYDRREFLVVPSNDGMVHVLQANTGADRATNPYIETLQYIPGTAQRNTGTDTVLRNLVFTAEKSYGDLRNPKQNFISGDVLNIQVDNEMSIVGGMGSGARGLYSLMMGGKDPSNNNVGMHQAEANWGSSVPWWDTSTSHFGAAGGYYNEFGYNFGLPKVGFVSLTNQGWSGTAADVRAAALVSSGMDTPSQATPALFVLDHMGRNYGRDRGRVSTGTRGQLIRKIEITRPYTATATAETTVAQIVQAHDGLTSVQAVDIDSDGLSDLAYAGDFKGNIWRFDLRGNTPANWGARMVYQGNGSQPLVAEPNLMHWGNGVVGIYFGTGSNLYQSDLTVHGQQTLYGVFDHANDCPVGAPATGVCAPATRTDLIQQQLTAATVGGVSGYYISTTNQYANDNTRRGFYIDLPATDFRITTTPEIITVRGRGSAGVIWNIEKIETTGSAIGASMTCTPAKTTAGGYRLITDAFYGSSSQYINWSDAPIVNNGERMATVSYAGSSGRSQYLRNSAAAIGQSGTLGGGTLYTRDQMQIDPNAGMCGAEGLVASSSSTGGVRLDRITCSVPQGVRRLSWREIF